MSFALMFLAFAVFLFVSHNLDFFDKRNETKITVAEESRKEAEANAKRAEDQLELERLQQRTRSSHSSQPRPISDSLIWRGLLI